MGCWPRTHQVGFHQSLIHNDSSCLPEPIRHLDSDLVGSDFDEISQWPSDRTKVGKNILSPLSLSSNSSIKENSPSHLILLPSSQPGLTSSTLVNPPLSVAEDNDELEYIDDDPPSIIIQSSDPIIGIATCCLHRF